MPIDDQTQTVNQEQVEPVVAQPTQTYQVPNQVESSRMKLPVVIIVFVLLIGAGVGTGFGASRLIKAGPSATPALGAPGTVSSDQVQVGETYGSDDTARFKDVSEGVLQKGGIDGEGTHHLIRPGGDSQTVYLTSSVVDLDPFVGDKVELHGETFSAQKASWFMDVGSVKVLELNVATVETSTDEMTAE